MQTARVPSPAVLGQTDITSRLWRLWRRHPFIAVLLLAVATRLAWVFIAHLGVHFMMPAERFAHSDAWQRPYQFTPWQSVDMWLRWDAFFYANIARDGYGEALQNLRAAFFPLYPLLVRVVCTLFRVSETVGLLCVGNVCDVLGWCVLAGIVRQRLGIERGGWAMLAFAAFPTRNFGFSGYSEGLFLLLASVAYAAYTKHRARRSGAALALLSACRPQGILLGIALFADAWRARKAKLLLACAATPLGLVAYMAFLQRRFADPLAFAHLQRVWGRGMHAPWVSLLAHGEPLDHLAMWAAVALCAGIMWRRAPLRDTLWVALSLLVPMSTGRVVSMARFVGVLFPLLFFVPLERPRVRRAYFCVCIAASVIVAFKIGQGAKVI